MRLRHIWIIVFAVLLAACDGRDNASPPAATPTATTTSTATPTPVPAATATPTATDTSTATPTSVPTATPKPVLQVGAARISIAPLRAGSAEAAANPQVPVFETFTDFDFTLTCRDDPAVQLHFEANALFEGVLDRPPGAEPFVDCGGTPGRFDPGIDEFADLNGNGQFDGDVTNPEGLEPFTDANGNGFFDAIWIGGFDSSRAALDVDAAAPPMATALVISYGQEMAVIVTLDTIGNVSTHLSPLRQRLAAELGLDAAGVDSPGVQRIIITSLHDHQGPDTIGLWGPDALNTGTVREALNGGLLDEEDLGAFAGVPVRSGIDFTYRRWLDDQVVAVVKKAVRNLRPATLRVAAAPAPMRPDATVLNPEPADQTESFRIERRDQLLMTDIRWPFIRDPLVLAVQAIDRETGETIATLVNWTNHVEAMGSRNSLLSADYAGYVRQRLEAVFGGVGIYAVGTVGGLQTPLRDTFVPVMDDQGNVLAKDGSRIAFADLYGPVLDGRGSAGEIAGELFAMARRAANNSAEKAASLGRVIAEVAVQALTRAELEEAPSLRASASSVLVPIENPGFLLVAALGGLEGREVLFKGVPSQGFVTDRPQQCGLVGCIRETITLLDFGRFQLLTTPGELLPEYVVGRPRPDVTQDRRLRFVRKDSAGNVVRDFGDNEFSPISGLRGVRPGAHLLVLGLAQSELGYFIPRSDFVNVFEGILPRPQDLDQELGILADFDLVPLLGLGANPGFEEGEMLTLRQIIETAWAKFPEDRYPATSLGGVSLVDVAGVDLACEHPNTAGNENSVSPRAGEVVYNAMCDLLDDGTANASCATKLPVPEDPNG